MKESLPWQSLWRVVLDSVINFISFQPEWPENTVPASKPEWYTPLFHLGTNSGSFQGVPAILGDFEKYRPKLWIRPE